MTICFLKVLIFPSLTWERSLDSSKEDACTITSLYTHDVNWTYIRRSEDVQYVFWTSYVRSVYVLCLRGYDIQSSIIPWLQKRLKNYEMLNWWFDKSYHKHRKRYETISIPRSLCQCYHRINLFGEAIHSIKGIFPLSVTHLYDKFARLLLRRCILPRCKISASMCNEKI